MWTGNQILLTPKFLAHAHGSVILEAQDFERHGRVLKSLLHPYEVLTALLSKNFVNYNLLHHLICKGDHQLVLADMLTDMLTMIVQDLEDHPSASSSFELTLRMRTSSELSQEHSIQNGCLCVHITHVSISLSKIFMSLNFVVGWTKQNILTPNFSQFTVFWWTRLLRDFF